jgi:hypothetical protein
VPSEALLAEFGERCEWGSVTAAGISMWAYACPNDRIVGDENLPGFVRVIPDVDGETQMGPVVQFLTKAPDAPLESVLDQVRAMSPGAESCIIEVGAHSDYLLMPTGEAFEAYQRYVRGEAGAADETVMMPCGPYGPSEGGGYTFRLVDGMPDVVAMIFWPSEIATYDPDTLRFAGD